MRLKAHTTVLALIVLLLYAVPTVDAQQTWYLTDNSSSINIGGGVEYVMYKDFGNGNSDVTLGKNTYWIADQPAQTTLDMSGTWTVCLVCNVGGTVDVSIGAVNTTKGSKYDPAATATNVILNSGANTITLLPTSFVIYPGEYLAIEIKPKKGTTPVIDVTGVTNSPSYVQYSSSIPSYPIPEFTTIALLVAGFVTVAGLMRWKR
jgi:hypothetical protein